MNPNPFVSLIHSRKFRVMIADVLISTLVYFVTKYAAPAIGNDILWLIGTLQPVIGVLIGSIAYEDAALKRTLEAPPTVLPSPEPTIPLS